MEKMCDIYSSKKWDKRKEIKNGKNNAINYEKLLKNETELWKRNAEKEQI